MRDGIDVSVWQHPQGRPIAYNQVAAAGYRWVAIKVNEGLSGVDAYAADDVAGFKAAGLEVVLYHFARPRASSAVVAADRFVALCHALDPQLERVLDVEDAGGLSWTQLAAWCETFDDRAGVELDYMNRNFFGHLGAVDYAFASRVWLAYPDHDQDLAGVYAVQYGQGPVPGVASDVDLNHLDGATVPSPQPVEDDDMNANQVAQAIETLYRIAGNGDVAGQLEWVDEIVAKPTDQRDAAVGYVAHLLRPKAG